MSGPDSWHGIRRVTFGSRNSPGRMSPARTSSQTQSAPTSSLIGCMSPVRSSELSLPWVSHSYSDAEAVAVRAGGSARCAQHGGGPVRAGLIALPGIVELVVRDYRVPAGEAVGLVRSRGAGPRPRQSEGPGPVVVLLSSTDRGSVTSPQSVASDALADR